MMSPDDKQRELEKFRAVEEFAGHAWKQTRVIFLALLTLWVLWCYLSWL